MGELFGSSVKSLLQQDPPPLPNEAELLDAVVQKVGPFADRDKLCYHIRISAGKVHWAVNSYFRSILASAWPAREDFDSRPSSNWQATASNSAAAAAGSASLSAEGIGADAQARAAAAPNSMPSQHGILSSCSSPCSLVATEQPATGAISVSGLQQSQLSSLSEAAVVRQCCSVAEAAAAAHADANAAAAATSAMHLDALPSNALECVLSYLELPSLLNAAASCKALHRAAQAEWLWRQLFLQRWGAVIFPISKHSSMVGSSRSGPTGAVVMRPTVYGGNASVGAGIFGFGAAAAAATAQGRHSCAGDAGSERQHQTAAAAEAAAGSLAKAGSGSTAGSLHRRQASAGGSSSSNAFVSRWNGSCLAGTGPMQAAASTSSSSVPRPAQPLPPLQQQRQRQLSQQYTAPSAACSNRSPQQVAPVVPNSGTTKHCWGCSCSSCTALPAAAPNGSWRLQYKQQHGYQLLRRCPKCGDATVVPIVYGFPSAPLLAGMGLKRLVLGGDHLIDSCHVWACSGCRSCFRFFPYADVQLWLQDDEAQQRLDQARVAAGRSSGRRGGGLGAAAGGGGGSQQQGGREAGDMAQEDAAAAAAGFPRYTYEL